MAKIARSARRTPASVLSALSTRLGGQSCSPPAHKMTVTEADRHKHITNVVRGMAGDAREATFRAARLRNKPHHCHQCILVFASIDIRIGGI